MGLIASFKIEKKLSLIYLFVCSFNFSLNIFCCVLDLCSLGFSSVRTSQSRIRYFQPIMCCLSKDHTTCVIFASFQATAGSALTSHQGKEENTFAFSLIHLFERPHYVCDFCFFVSRQRRNYFSIFFRPCERSETTRGNLVFNPFVLSNEPVLSEVEGSKDE